MELTKEAIHKHKNSINGLEGYFTIVSKIENNVTVNPDIAIEACKSLIEGLSKKALELLSEEYQKHKSVRKDCDNKLPTLVRKALETLYRSKIEIDLHDSLYNFIKGKVKIDLFVKNNTATTLENVNDAIQKIAIIRDNRGDISHGRIYPKKDESEIHLSKSIISITDGICSFMINEFSVRFTEQKESDSKLIYDENVEFNEWLDEKYNILSTKVDFSKLLYQNAYGKYEEVYYSDYTDSLTENEEEGKLIIEKVKEIIEQSEHSLSETLQKALEDAPKLTEEESKKLTDAFFGQKEEPKEVVQLINTFDEKTFWTSEREVMLTLFSEENNIQKEKFKKLIEDYIFYEQPLDLLDINNVLNVKLSIFKNNDKLDELRGKITDLIIELKES